MRWRSGSGSDGGSATSDCATSEKLMEAAVEAAEELGAHRAAAGGGGVVGGLGTSLAVGLLVWPSLESGRVPLESGEGQEEGKASTEVVD